MNLDRSLLLRSLIPLAVLYALNFHCWQPGFGRRTDVKPDGTRPAGSEMEIYLGFPACYRAELWRSDKQGPTLQLLRSAPFLNPPASMRVVAKYTSAAAILSNLLFAAAAFTVALLLFTETRHHWNRRAMSTAIVCVAVAIACYLTADHVSTHL